MKINNLILFIPIIIFLALGCTSSGKTEKTDQQKIRNTASVKTKNIAEKDTHDAPAVDKLYDTIITDLNDDGKTDTLWLIDNTSRQGDPGRFLKIKIALNGFECTTFKAKDAWDKVDSSFLSKNSNAVKSDNLFIYKAKDATFLLLFGYIYGAGREEFSVIQIKNDKAKMVYDDAMDWPGGFEDIEHDGSVAFVCAPTSSEVIEERTDGEIQTYDPYQVYSITNGFKLDEELTKKYNLENYVWAGKHVNTNIKVLHPKDGSKLRIIK